MIFTLDAFNYFFLHKHVRPLARETETCLK